MKKLKSQFNQKLKAKSGFTLFEMIVSLGLFSVAMLMILTSLLSITSAQKKAVTLQTVEDNLRFVIDSMSKEIRTGSGYDCGNIGAPNNCGNTGNVCISAANSMAFTRADGVPVIYRLQNESIEKSDNGNPFYTVTGSDIKINKLDFCVTGVNEGGDDDGLQPRTTIIIKATADIMEREKTKSPFNLQTTVTQRRLDS